MEELVNPWEPMCQIANFSHGARSSDCPPFLSDAEIAALFHHQLCPLTAANPSHAAFDVTDSWGRLECRAARTKPAPLPSSPKPHALQEIAKASCGNTSGKVR